MQQSLLQEKYPVFTLSIDKSETPYASIDAVVDYLRDCIRSHPYATYITTFDHYAHTKSLSEGQVAPEILAAKNLVFCFGLTLPDPRMLAVRPRSIGVAELAQQFVVSFLEAPMPVANSAIEGWVRALHERQAA